MAKYAFTDIHGNYDLWLAIKNYCKEDDEIFFLGDAIDRGPDGIKIMQELFKDKRVTYIIGNHEDMFLDYIKNIDMALLTQKSIIVENETLVTLRAFQALSEQEQEELIYNLKTKTIYKTLYINKDNKKIYLSHSGFSFKDLLSDRPADFIWNRNHLTETEWGGDEDTYIVHGHSPVQYLQTRVKELEGKKSITICKYCHQHKIDLDLATFVSKKIALLDLDTLEPIYFVE